VSKNPVQGVPLGKFTIGKTDEKGQKDSGPPKKKRNEKTLPGGTPVQRGRNKKNPHTRQWGGKPQLKNQMRDRKRQRVAKTGKAYRLCPTVWAKGSIEKQTKKMEGGDVPAGKPSTQRYHAKLFQKRKIRGWGKENL